MNKQNVVYAKQLTLKGKVITLSKDILNYHRPVSFELVKIDKIDNFGQLEVRWQSLVFNSVGVFSS